MNKKASWGIVGLGVMGTNISRNFVKNDISLALYNRHIENKEEKVAYKRTQEFIELSSSLAFESLDSFIKALKRPRKVLLMLPSGEPIDKLIKDILPLLSEGDIILDGGNSHFENTEKRLSMLAKNKIRFLGVGISGGDQGALKGPSLMVGGDKSAYKTVSKDLESIAAKNSYGGSCCEFLGSGGAGHYIKMIHNGIEYAEMQLICEVFELSLISYSKNLIVIKKLFEKWQKSRSESYLLDITSKILAYEDNGVPFINKILDKASNKRTGIWASIGAEKLESPNNLISAALNARFISKLKNDRDHYSKVFKRIKPKPLMTIPNFKKAYDICRWINHHQAFDLIRLAKDKYNWSFELSQVAKLWLEGSIIKSKLMDLLAIEYKNKSSIMEMDAFKILIKNGQKQWANTIIYSVNQQIPIPCIVNAWNYFIAITQEKSSANLIQAQRDFFGVHGFETTNQRKKLVHGPWSSRDE